MRPKSRRGVRLATLVLGGGLAATLVLGGRAEAAEPYPSKPLTIIVPFSAGGSVDRMARGLASFLTYELDQPVIVRNKPGAGGQLGHTYFLQQPDDGHTLLVTPATPYIVSNIFFTNAKYKMDDFAFINAQWVDYTMVAVPKGRPYKTMGDLMEDIKNHPKKVSTGVSFGSAGHLSTIVLLKALKIPVENLKIVTYTGGGPLRVSMAGGHVDFSIIQAEGSEVIRDNIRALAVFQKEKNKEWNAPPINETLQKYGVTIPLISGSVRVLAASMSFKKKHPERWKKLVAAYRKTLKRKDFRRWLKRSQIGDDWFGPEKTTEMINENFEVLKQYKDLLKKPRRPAKKKKG